MDKPKRRVVRNAVFLQALKGVEKNPKTKLATPNYEQAQGDGWDNTFVPLKRELSQKAESSLRLSDHKASLSGRPRLCITLRGGGYLETKEDTVGNRKMTNCGDMYSRRKPSDSNGTLSDYKNDIKDHNNSKESQKHSIELFQTAPENSCCSFNSPKEAINFTSDSENMIKSSENFRTVEYNIPLSTLSITVENDMCLSKNNMQELKGNSDKCVQKHQCRVDDLTSTILKNQKPEENKLKFKSSEVIDTFDRNNSWSDAEATQLQCSSSSFNQKIPNLTECEIHVSQTVPAPVPKQIEAITELLVNVAKERAFPEKNRVPDFERNIRKIICKHIQGCDIFLYGSCLSGFAIGTSNVNIGLSTNGKYTSKLLTEVFKILLEEKSDYQDLTLEDHDYKDVRLTFIEPNYDLCCEIKLLSRNKKAYQTSLLLQKFSEDERVKTLGVVFRHWAENQSFFSVGGTEIKVRLRIEEIRYMLCEIHEEANGMLHPLCFILMLIHFLQQHQPQVLPVINVQQNMKGENILDSKNTQTVGELWLGLFKYYSLNFNWRDQVVSILQKEIVYKETKIWSKNWIAIEDPCNTLVNVAKTVVSPDASLFIQSCFHNTYKYYSFPTSNEKDVSICEEFDVNENFSHNTNRGFITENESYDQNHQQKVDFCYKFNEFYFTQGKSAPVNCSACTELGFTCSDCSNGYEFEPDHLPEMTSEYLKIIDEVLEHVFKQNTLSDEEVKKREMLVKDLEIYIAKYYPGKNIKLELFGSSANGFGFHSSDMDICLTFENVPMEDVNQKQEVKSICSHMRKNADFHLVRYICSSKVPLVKFVHRQSHLRGDISLYNRLAVYNTRLLYTYSKIDQRAKILGCAMKFLAKNGCIADSPQRSLSSYSYILMVIHFLQQIFPPVLPVLQQLYNQLDAMPEDIVDGHNVWFCTDIEQWKCQWKDSDRNAESVGKLWLDFLNYYTVVFKAADNFVTIRQLEPLPNFQKESTSRLFNIEDPFIIEQNLGAVMSESMSIKTMKTLLRARKLFGTPIDHLPAGFKNFEEYLFHPINLTGGRVMNKEECWKCGKMGHTINDCPQFRFSRPKYQNYKWPGRPRLAANYFKGRERFAAK